MSLKVMTVIGTRPEIIRLSRVIPKLDQHLDHIMVHTGQNYDYELNQVFFEDLEIRKPDYFLEAAGKNACDTVCKVISRVDALLADVKPDAMLVLGDTNSCLAAYPAKRRKVPIFHMEAGNRCFDQRVPEEINRRIVDHISDINLPYSDISREYLLREGLPPDCIIKTGSPMYEVFCHFMPKIDSSVVLDRLKLSPGEYYIVSAHREENIDSPRMFASFIDLLIKLADHSKRKVIVSTHPRTRQRIESEGVMLPEKVVLMKPFGFFDYIQLQRNAKVVLSDSGTITEESSILNFPALNIRETHERPEGMEEASVMLTGFNWGRIMTGLSVLESQGRGTNLTLRPISDYLVPNVSEKVVRIILSYTDYVNREIWNKQ
jgi:UDP-N-acetylglucosamine 2-epimerase (non-hydrolysing)